MNISSDTESRKKPDPLGQDEKLDVLLVEDDAVDRMAIERYVADASLPYSLCIVGGIREAMRLLHERRFDVILCDFNLPDGTALDVIAEAHGIPTVVITGSGSEQIAVKTMKAGARDYLVKDHERAYLHLMPIAVSNAVERCHADRERERLIVELRHALADIKVLRGLLPVCAKCKKIRDEKGSWIQMETYIQKHSDATFSHGLCPNCAGQMISEIEDWDGGDGQKP